MFEECGRKLKVVAVLLFILGLMATAVGFVLATRVDVLLALGVLVGGAVGSWLLSLVLYTIGTAAEEPTGKTEEEEKEDKKAKRIEKILDTLCDD